MMACLRFPRFSVSVSTSVLLLAGLIAALLLAPRAATQGQASYTIIAADGRRPLPFRTSNNVDLVPLDQLAALFSLKVTEDTLAGGLLIETRGQRIIAVPGQSFVQAAGRVVQLSAPITRERNTWLVPVDFVTQALGPATSQRIVLRRPSRLILVGDVRVPLITTRAEKTANGGRVIVDIDPPTPHKVTREGNRLVIRFDALALDPGALTAQIPDFVSGARVEGTTLVLTLGAAATEFRAEDDRDGSPLTIDLAPAPPPPPPPPPGGGAPGVPRPQEPPTIDLAPGTIRTVVIDPGHGGADEGVKGAGGTKEKDFTLQMARRLKATIESRLGLRVLLTRDSDEDVPLDRRTALANNNKADLFLSLHANASVRSTVRGAQVLSLSLEDYPGAAEAGDPRRTSVPVLGGAMRNIEPVPWNFAQLPFARRSSALAAIVIQHLNERHVQMYGRPASQAPLRVLVGANMPAVMVELGFLSNAADEKALTSGDVSAAIIDAMVVSVSEVRRGIPDLTPPREQQR
jgi:N-acetylmuramoyl-L-alanine amidase